MKSYILLVNDEAEGWVFHARGTSKDDYKDLRATWRSHNVEYEWIEGEIIDKYVDDSDDFDDLDDDNDWDDMIHGDYPEDTFFHDKIEGDKES